KFFSPAATFVWVGSLTKRRDSSELLAVVFRQSLTDAGGEIRRVAGGFCALSYVAASSEICERQVRVDLAAFIEKLIEVPVSEQSPVQATASDNVLYMVAYGRRAFLRQRVVPSRMAGDRF